MCFTIDEINFPEPRVADKDIKCRKMYFKTGDLNEFKSIHQNHIVKLGETYTEEEFGRYDIIATGITDTQTHYEKIINKGFHSWGEGFVVSVGITHPDLKIVIMLCTIPKGTLYMHNRLWGEYVSQSIRIDKPIVKS